MSSGNPAWLGNVLDVVFLITSENLKGSDALPDCEKKCAG